MTRVATYQHAYLSARTIDLCARHADATPEQAEYETVLRIFGSLGGCTHGTHRGECAACVAERDARLTRMDSGFSRLRDDEIRRLGDEAGAAGDMAQVELCERALLGNEDSYRECLRVIDDYAAAEP